MDDDGMDDEGMDDKGIMAGGLDDEGLLDGNALFAVGIEEDMFGTFVVVYMITVLSGCVTKIA